MAGQGQLARKVRAGLSVIEGGRAKQQPSNELDRLWYRKPIRRHVREFAALFATIFIAVSGWMIYRGNPTYPVPAILMTCAGLLLLLGYKFPAVLRPVWSGWMKFAVALGVVMTGLILFAAWCVVLLPIALLVKTLRIRVMNTDFRTEAATYWQDRDSKLDDFKLLERQF